MSKVTMQTIADTLGISRVSVWNALNRQSGLSEELRTAVFLKAAELGYTKIPSTVATSQRKNIGLIICQPEGSRYWTEIAHRIAKVLSVTNHNLLYTFLPDEYTLGYMLPVNLSDGSMDGAIILGAFDVNIIQLLNTLTLPKVYLDTSALLPLSNINGDLVLLEGENQIRTITEHIIEKGRRDLAFIGDLNYCWTYYERYLGYTAALSEHDLPISDKSYITRTGNDCAMVDILHHLNNLQQFPEAFICTNDYIASVITNYMLNLDKQIPEEIFITGFDRILNFFSSEDFITSVTVQLDTLSKRLVSQVLFRIDNPSASLERIYIRSNVFYGKSTDF